MIREGDLVDLKTDNRYRNGIVMQIVYERAYVSWPENEDNGEAAYSPHLMSNLVLTEGQLTLF